MRYIIERYKDSAKNTRYEEIVEGSVVEPILKREAEWCAECSIGHRRYVIVRDVITVRRQL